MKEMIKKAKAERGGFTLAELLIVVAIVLVLAAIAIPIFMGALNNADKAVQNAQIASVKQAAVTHLLTTPDAAELETGEVGWKVVGEVSASGAMGPLTYEVVTAVGTDEGAAKQTDGHYDVVVYITPTEVKAKS
jgi:prepilin-type N-terminal cleavage/methylation domain-containing protein